MSNGLKFFLSAAVIIMLGMFAVNASNNKKAADTVFNDKVQELERRNMFSVSSRGGYIEETADLYEKISGKIIETDEKNPMFKDSSERIVKAWKIGIIDDGDTAFYYGNSGIQYQTAAQLLYKTVILAEPDFAISDNEALYWLNNCYENIGIDEKNICGMAFLYKYGIASGVISPEAFITDADAGNLIDGARRVFAKDKKVEISGKTVEIGMSRTKLVRLMGSPNRIEQSGSGFLWYVYNSNYAEFIMVGVYNDVVCAFFTNCREFKFGDVKSGTEYSDISDKSVKYYLNGEKKVDGIFFSNINGEYINTETAGEDIADIINAVRVKRGAGELYFSETEKSENILEIFGANVWECYEKLIGAGYAAPFEFAKDSKGCVSANVSEKDGNMDIALKAEKDDKAERKIENVIPEKAYYKGINKEKSNISAPEIISPSDGAELYGDVEVAVDLGKSDYYRIVLADNETLEILVNSYIAYSDRIILPSYLFSSGGDYILSVYTPDGEKNTLTEFSYGAAEPPEIKTPRNTVYGDTVDIIWDSGRYSECLIEIFNADSELTASSRVSGQNETEVSGIDEGKYTVRVSALKKNTNIVKAYSEAVFNVKRSEFDIIYSTQPPSSSGSSKGSSSVKFKSDKYARIFGESRKVYSSKKEADENIVKITVPVWKIDNGRKVSSTEDIMINKALAGEVYEIFLEIYLGSERFPIKSVGAYSWRSTATGTRSQHSYGTAIDINANENYCIYNSGRKIGSFWKPGENPYSIPSDGDVVRAFKSRGWTWGAEWNSLKDYMHFSYLGG